MLDIDKKKYLTMKAMFAKRVGYKPSEGQYKVHTSLARNRCCCAGARFGKSMAGGFEAAFHVAAFADFRVWIVAPIYDLSDKEFDWALDFLGRYEVKPGISLLRLCRLSSPVKGSRAVETPWGSFIKTKSTDNPDSLLGDELDLMILGEAGRIPKTVWERELRARLGPREGMVFAASTAAGDTGLFAEFLEEGRKGTPDWETWELSTIDNPTFSLVEYEVAKRQLDPDVFAEQYEGKLISRRGLVFKFDETKHVIPDSQIPQEVRILNTAVSVQPGGQNPSVAVFMTYNPTQNLYYVLDEIYDEETIFTDTVDKIKVKMAGKNLIGGIITDWANREAQTKLEKAGLAVVVNDTERKLGRNPALAARTQTMQSILKIIDGMPRIVISDKCIRLIEDFKKCKWPDSPREEADRLVSEIPLLKYFQGPQALAHIFNFIGKT